MFRFTPSPVPSAGIFWWTGLNGFSTRGCVLNPDVERWFDKSFPPLSLYQYVSPSRLPRSLLIMAKVAARITLVSMLGLPSARHSDYSFIVLCDKLIERLRTHEPNVKVMRM